MTLTMDLGRALLVLHGKNGASIWRDGWLRPYSTSGEQMGCTFIFLILVQVLHYCRFRIPPAKTDIFVTSLNRQPFEQMYLKVEQRIETFNSSKATPDKEARQSYAVPKHILALKVNVRGGGWFLMISISRGSERDVEVCSVLSNKAVQKLIKRALLSVRGSRV